MVAHETVSERTAAGKGGECCGVMKTRRQARGERARHHVLHRMDGVQRIVSEGVVVGVGVAAWREGTPTAGRGPL